MRPIDVADRIIRGTHPPVARLEQLVEDVLVDVLEVDRTDAAIRAEPMLKHVWIYLIQRLSYEERRGRHPSFSVRDAARRELEWLPAILEGTHPADAISRVRLRDKGRVLDHLDTVDDRTYEFYGAVLCRLGGAERVLVMPGKSDEGIDFIALVPAFGRTHVWPHSRKMIRILGQAKKWGTPIKRSTVDELTSVVDRARRRNEGLVKFLPTWFMDDPAPLVGCLLSHKGAQAGAWARARQEGAIICESADIAEAACLTRERKLHGDDPVRVLDELATTLPSLTVGDGNGEP